MRDFFLNPPQPHENYYDILALPYSFDFSDPLQVAALHRAYNDVVIYHHPANHANEHRRMEAKKIFDLLGVAFKTLMNTKQRAAYNIETGIAAEIKPTATIEAAASAASSELSLPESEVAPHIKPSKLEIDPIDYDKFNQAMAFRNPKPTTTLTTLFGKKSANSLPEIPNMGEARQNLPRIVQNLNQDTTEEALKAYFLLFNKIKELEENLANLKPVIKLLKESFGQTRYEILSQLKARQNKRGADLDLAMFSAIFPYIRHDNRYIHDQYFTPSMTAFINADLLDLGVIRQIYTKKGETLAFCDLLRTISQTADIQHNIPLRLECKNFFHLRAEFAATLASSNTTITSFASRATPEATTYFLIACLKMPLATHTVKSIITNDELRSQIENLAQKLSEIPQRAVYLDTLLKASSLKKEMMLKTAIEVIHLNDAEQMYRTTVTFLQNYGDKTATPGLINLLPSLLEAAYRAAPEPFITKLTAEPSSMPHTSVR